MTPTNDAPVTVEQLAQRKAVNTVLGALLAPLIADPVQRITAGNEACTLILSRLAALASAPAGDGVAEVRDEGPIPEARSSLIARAIRQSLRKYGHKVAESSLPECIASDVEATLRTMRDDHPALARPRAAVGEREAGPSIDLAYTLGFGDARGLAASLVWNQREPFTREALCAKIRAIVGPASEAGWDGAEMPLTLALERIDGEAPISEPRDGPTIGFAPSHDPEHCDGNDVVEDAFREGVLRGRWEAADVARKAILALQAPPAKVEG